MKTGSFLEHFSVVPDPRSTTNRKHLLIDILFITLCAVICGAKGWEEIAEFGGCRKDWLKQFISLPNGIPSHDTFRDVFLFLDTEKFNESFGLWILDIAKKIPGEIISIDGKTSRRSHSKNTKPLHLVSAWANKNSLILGQMKVSEKSNEITAIPEILKALDIHGCIVTIDAMGCQKDIAEKIIENGGDYILALKGNQGNFHEQVKDFMDISVETNFEDVLHEKTVTIEKDHGRIETREYYLINELDWLENREDWVGLNSVGVVVSQRKTQDKTTTEARLYISSLKSDVKRFAEGVRSHWGVESMHWTLDVSFQEDQCRKRMEKSAANFAIVRHFALNLLKKESTYKAGIVRKQFKSALTEEYLEKVLQCK
jgi:predicted transposase YbfD/YdcC